MRNLRFLAILFGFFIVVDLSVGVAVARPMTAERAQYLLEALPADPEHRDLKVYATTKAELKKKIEEAKQFPARADAILNDLYIDMIRFSPIEGYDPANNARTAAALECHIEIQKNRAQKTSQTKQQEPKSTTSPAQVNSGDDHAQVFSAEIVKEATSGGKIDTSKFFPESSNTNTNTNTNTNSTVRTRPDVSAGLRSGPRSDSTVTGLTSSYQPITRAAAQNIVGKYKSTVADDDIAIGSVADRCLLSG